MFNDDPESFPGATDLFRAAFALRDPYPEVLRLINLHPNSGAIVDCVAAYAYAAQQNPERAERLAGILLRLRDGPNAPSLPQVEQGLTYLYYQTLAFIHNKELAIGFDDTTPISSKKPFLIHSYLSAISLKYGLTDCGAMYGAIAEGLDTARDINIREQTMLLGACLQLLLCGSRIVPQGVGDWSGPADVAAKLREQKKRGLIKNSNIGKILDVRSSHIALLLDNF